MRRLLLYSIGLLISMSICSAHDADEMVGFAKYLLREGDYLAAANQYREVAYIESADSLKLDLMLWTARSFRLADIPQKAYQYSTHVRKHSAGSSLEGYARLEMGLVALDAGRVPEAQYSFTLADSLTSSILPANYKRFLELFYKSDSSSPSSFEGSSINADLDSKLSNLSVMMNNADYKNPLAATLFSTVLPGSGQFYAKHPVDGIQAFLMVGALAFTTYMAYEYENERNDAPGGLFISSAVITSIFHAANILGAKKTVGYYNHRLRMNCSGEARFLVDEEYMDYFEIH